MASENEQAPMFQGIAFFFSEGQNRENLRTGKRRIAVDLEALAPILV